VKNHLVRSLLKESTGTRALLKIAKRPGRRYSGCSQQRRGAIPGTASRVVRGFRLALRIENNIQVDEFETFSSMNLRRFKFCHACENISAARSLRDSLPQVRVSGSFKTLHCWAFISPGLDRVMVKSFFRVSTT